MFLPQLAFKEVIKFSLSLQKIWDSFFRNHLIHYKRFLYMESLKKSDQITHQWSPPAHMPYSSTKRFQFPGHYFQIWTEHQGTSYMRGNALIWKTHPNRQKWCRKLEKTKKNSIYNWNPETELLNQWTKTHIKWTYRKLALKNKNKRALGDWKYLYTSPSY